MEAAQSRLTEMTVTSSVGGGAVQVTMSGDQVCKSVTIDPELLKDADADMLQDLILSAVNQALDKSSELATKEMGPLAAVSLLIYAILVRSLTNLSTASRAFCPASSKNRRPADFLPVRASPMIFTTTG
jgi:DNA-binding YbaB/EbfC family protein